MRKKEILVIFVLGIALTILAVGGYKILEKDIELVEELPLVTSLTELDQYYGKKIKVRGKTGSILAKLPHINLANGEVLTLLGSSGPEFDQQWVEATGLLEPLTPLDPNVPVAGQNTGPTFHIQEIKKIELQNEERYCQEDNDCVVVAKSEKGNICCLGCDLEAINKLTERERNEWEAINCAEAVCPIYDCYNEKLATPKCKNNRCEISWVEKIGE